QKVRTLISENQKRGIHNIGWKGKDEQNQMVANGVYFCRISADKGSVTQKMLLLK
ncbi:MAG: hypothetical protein K8S56_05050, partial [Candidatus Cloacimonetes bacterium]|nr:hypothetical protein [Candidatus Cloacimonadota bacterium]